MSDECEYEDIRNGAQFGAWIGLVPRQHSSGGKNSLGGITKRGDISPSLAADPVDGWRVDGGDANIRADQPEGNAPVSSGRVIFPRIPLIAITRSASTCGARVLHAPY